MQNHLHLIKLHLLPGKDVTGQILESYLHQVACLITTEERLFDIGMELDISHRDITRAQVDNPKDIQTAAIKLLMKWKKTFVHDDPSLLKEKVADAFKNAGLAIEFQSIATHIVE